MTSTVTIDGLIAEYAAPIAACVGLTASDYDRSAKGLSGLLNDAADRLGNDQIGSWLEEAAADLAAVARLGDSGPKTQQLLDRTDTTLYEARTDLELSC